MGVDRNLTVLPIHELAIGGFGFSAWLNLDVFQIQAFGTIADGNGDVWTLIDLAAFNVAIGEEFAPGYGWCHWHVAANPTAAVGQLAILTSLPARFDFGAPSNAVALACRIVAPGERVYLGSLGRVIAIRAWPLGGAQLPPAAPWDLQAVAHDDWDYCLTISLLGNVE